MRCKNIFMYLILDFILIVICYNQDLQINAQDSKIDFIGKRYHGLLIHPSEEERRTDDC